MAAEPANRVVVAFPRIEDAEPWRAALAVRERYDPIAAEMPAHLTLVFPFCDPIPDEDLRQHIREAIAGLPSFAIILSEITGHESEYLFLNVKRGNDQLVEIHDRLYTGPLARHRLRSHTYVPHVTVGRLSAEQLAGALEVTAAVTTAIRATVDLLTVYAIDPPAGRPVLFEVPLESP